MAAQRQSGIGRAPALLLLLLARPGFAACTAYSYPISNENCMNQGEAECLRRFESVTGDNGDGPVQVGGTPLQNPFNPSACPPKQNDSKVAAYSSLGLDPGNPANYKKYNLKTFAPIQGWPGEFHFHFDDNLKAWRASIIIRGRKAGVRTVEPDNSDPPGYDQGKVAAQLNHECQLHRAFGEPCVLKNTPGILPLLSYTPDYWILETGDGNGGEQLIQTAKGSGVPGKNIYIVHYGPADDRICNMIPESNVVFSRSQDLSVPNLSHAPASRKGGAPKPPAPLPSNPQCARQDKPLPPEDEDDRRSPLSAPSEPALAGPAASPAPPAASRSAQEPARDPPAQYPVRDPERTASFLPGKQSQADPSTVTGKRFGDLASSNAEEEGDRTAGYRAPGRSGGLAGASRPPELPAGGASAHGKTGVGGRASAPEAGRLPGATSARAAEESNGNSYAAAGGLRAPASGKTSSEALAPYGGASLGDPKVALSGADIDSAMDRLEAELSPANGDASLFERIHQVHHRCLLGGRLSAAR